MTPEDLLTRTFAEVTETTDYPTTPMATVVARSRTLRHGRRRATALLAAAAAVVLVGGSVAVWLNHGPDTPPSPSHRLDPAASLPDVPQGDAPRIAYLDGDGFVTAAGDRITSPAFRTAMTATPYGEGVLVVRRSTPARPFTTISLVSGGSTTPLGCGAPTFALGGEAPTYWLADTCGANATGRLVEGTSSTTTPRGVVYYPIRSTSSGLVALRSSTAALIAADGSAHRIPHVQIVTAASPAGDLVAGRAASQPQNSVIVDTATGAVRWRAAHWSLGHFSTSGQYVVGTQRVGDQTVSGVGDVVGIWDVATGRQVMTTVLPNMSVVGGPAWEGDDSVLVVVQDRHLQQAIVRVGRDGSITRATSVAPAGTGTFRLASTP